LALHPLEIRFAELHVTDNGVVLYDLMVLSAIDQADKAAVVEALDLAFRTP
jgi:hypothetical protein